MAKKSVLILGLDPSLIDFSDPAYGGFPGMNGDKVMAGLQADERHLNEIGYDAEVCLTDFGATAEAKLRLALARKAFDCVVIGAGLRVITPNFLLFERLLNVVHAFAPQARLCFNTRPDDTAAAVQRWV